MAVLLAVLAATGSLVLSTPRPAAAEASSTTADPTLYTTPSCLTGSETSVGVSGRNFAPNTTVYVWDMYNYPGDPAYGNSTQVTTDAYGTFTLSKLDITKHAGAPSHNITTSYSDGYTYVTGVIMGPCDARLTVSPMCSTNQKSLSITMSNFNYPSTDPISVQVVNIDTKTVAGTGSFDVTGTSFSGTVKFSTNSYPNGLPNGEYRIVATQGTDPAAGNYRTATTYFAAPCPAVSVVPNCSTSGKPPNQLSLTVTTTGFVTDYDYSISNVEIVFDDGGAEPQEFSTDAQSPNDSFLITPYARATGHYTVTVKQGYNPGYIVGSPFSDVTTLIPAWTDRRFSQASTTFSVTCPAPTISLSPDCGDLSGPGIGQTVTITGSNFQPNVTATFVFDVKGIFEQEPSQVAVDANGNINASIVAEYRLAGTYDVQAYQDVNGVRFEADTTWVVPCVGPPISPPPTATPSPTPTPTLTPPPAAPFLLMSPTCMPVADGQSGAYSLSLTGGGFLPGAVTVVLDPSGTPFAGTIETDASGYISATFVADGKPAGSYQLLAYQDNNGIHIEASATLTVPCATLTIDPTCVAPAEGKAAAYTITASGVGFDPGPVDLIFDPTGLTPLTGQVLTDSFGSFSGTFTIDGKAPGIYELVASQSSSYGLPYQSIAQLLVPCDRAVVRITPSTGSRGFVPVVEGFGFKPLTTLTVQWDVGIGARQPVTVQTDGTGYFRVELVVYQHDFLGLRHVTVMDPSNPAAYTNLAQPYLVAEAPIQPPFSSEETTTEPPPDPVILQR